MRGCIFCEHPGVKFRGVWVCPNCFKVDVNGKPTPLGEVLVNRRMRRAFR